MSHRLENRVAVIAGAGRGIGRAISLAFAKEGARLVLAARTRAELEETAAGCREAGASAVTLSTDVSDWGQVQALVDTAIKTNGRIDILVNSAGVYGPIGPTSDVDPDAWTRAVAVNLLGTFYLCRAVIPHMKTQVEGKIILLGGGGATAPLPNFSSYAAAKAGVARLADTLAEELREFNIQVNVIAPGLVDTRLQDDVIVASQKAGPLFEKIKTARETRRGAVSPDIAASLAVFLASSASGALTGKLISAPHDPWREWSGKSDEINRSPMYTIRRLDPFTIAPLVKDLSSV